MGRKIPQLMLSSSLAIVLFGGFVFTACNSVTGADDISLYSTDDDDDGGSNNNGATTGGEGGNDPVTTGTGAAGPAGSTGSGDPSSNSSSQQASSSSGGPDPCVYPAGPYGVAQGNTLPPTLSWQAYAPGASSPSTLTSEDLFDCDGAKGIDVVVIDTSQYG